jgi:hypothetical protein
LGQEEKAPESQIFWQWIENAIQNLKGGEYVWQLSQHLGKVFVKEESPLKKDSTSGGGRKGT